jgi:Family of unknown function (DUF6518)
MSTASESVATRPRPVATPGPAVALIVVAGLVSGVLTQIGQSILPPGFGQAANAISPWLLVAFALGSLMPSWRWAAVAGVGSMLVALVGYYGMVELRFGYGGGTGSIVFWGVGALAGGTVFGIAGHWWRDDRPWHRAIGIGLLAAVTIAEGVYLIGVLTEPIVGVMFIAAGVSIPPLVGRSTGDSRRGYLATVPALALGLAGYTVFGWLYGWTSPL